MSKLTAAIRCGKQAGMTMLEVVVSMLVIGLGLAMSVSMIQRSTQFSDSAATQGVALGLMYDLVNVMRANNSLATKYVFSTDDFSKLSQGKQCTTTDYTKQDKITACERVNNDLKEWRILVEDRWPAGSPICAELSSTADVAYGYTIELRWNDSHKDGDDISDCAKFRQSSTMNFTL